jgi:EAL domain-containing protein (putative c-di-GMP-specific phosphodiesterase class I)
VLIRNADTAMYHAKAERGRGYSYYADGMKRDTCPSGSISSRACAKRSSAERFVLHYQPQIELATGAVIAVEALLRWRDPTRRLIPPAVFIPMAVGDRHGAPIGASPWRRACADAIGWRSAARPAAARRGQRVEQAARRGRLRRSRRARAARDGLAAERLQIEITESSILEQRGPTLATLQALRRLGCGVVIDDFGTGYAALTALRWLPPTA